ncbi:unnamed protein product [Paramecium octaurelia]|uniref:Uncharacterized protein n=1 Tax=Paramecium octaurelia TaxID=43137 RepID=A0A8S1YIE9_PAROT|nr:unnamed protein product [Paramecium octaurelia]
MTCDLNNQLLIDHQKISLKKIGKKKQMIILFYTDNLVFKRMKVCNLVITRQRSGLCLQFSQKLISTINQHFNIVLVQSLRNIRGYHKQQCLVIISLNEKVLFLHQNIIFKQKKKSQFDLSQLLTTKIYSCQVENIIWNWVISLYMFNSLNRVEEFMQLFDIMSIKDPFSIYLAKLYQYDNGTPF